MTKLNDLAMSWLFAKQEEKDAVEARRLIEDEMAKICDISQTDEMSLTVKAGDCDIKIVTRLARKVDSDLAQEIAAENDLDGYLPILFRWKPEINMSAWKSADERIRSALAPAITTTPGRPSFTVTKKENA